MFEDRLAQSLENLEIGAYSGNGSLGVYPLLGPDKPGPAYLTLEEALRDSLAVVTEVSVTGHVPELLFENKGELPILLVDGEELIGAKQNRVLNLTILVRGKSKVSIPVSCVERGRWAGAHQPFAASDRTMFAQARASKAEQVSESLRKRRSRASDQGQVWRDIEARINDIGAPAPTAAMSAAFEHSRDHVDRLIEPHKPVKDQRGAIYVVNGAVAGIEMFDKSATYAKLAAKLARSYALDASGSERVAPAKDALIASLAFDRLKRLHVEHYPGTDLGTDLRLNDERMTGAALFAEPAIVHLAAYAKQ